MADLKELKQQLVDYLSDHFSGQGVAVMGEFPPSPKPSPLLKSRIAVGFDAMAVQDAGLDDYLGEDSSQTLRGRYVQITLRFDLAWGVGPAKGCSRSCSTPFSSGATAWGGRS